MIKRTGDLLGGLTIGSFQGLTLQSLEAGSSAEVIYAATLVLSGTSVTASNNSVIGSQVITTGTTPTDLLLVRSGVSQVSGTAIKSFTPFANTAFVSGQTRSTVVPGTVTFQALLAGSGSTQAIVSAAASGTTASLSTIALSGTSFAALLGSQQPNLSGAKWVSFNSPITDNIGEGVSLLGTCRVLTTVNEKAVTTDTTGIFSSVTSGSTFEPLALAGGAAVNTVGMPMASGSYTAFSNPVVADDSGSVAFEATIKGGSGIWWTGASGTLALVVQTGSSVTVVSGSVSTKVTFKAFTGLALPAGGGGPLFVATLTGVPAASSTILCGVDSTGALIKLVQTGDSNLPGTTKTVKSFDVIGVGAVPGTSGVTRSFSENGLITYRVTFTDNSQAIVKGYVQ
jgi:hypothetical protein